MHHAHFRRRISGGVLPCSGVRMILAGLLGGTASLLPAGMAMAQEPPSLHTSLGAPENLKLSVSIRARYEALDGQPRAGLDASTDLFSLRTTLFAEYDAGRVRIGGELYDSRVYLGEPGSGVSTSEVNALELVQAYVVREFGNPFGPDTSAALQAGRFTLNLGSRRLVAADDYRNTTSGYTGLRLDLKASNGMTSTLIYTLPQRRLPDDLPSLLDNDVALDRESAALVLWGGLVTVPEVVGMASLEAGFYGLDEQDERALPTRNRRLRTGNLRLFRDPAAHQMDYEIEGAYQTGSVRASTAVAAPELDVSAYFYHLKVGYRRAGGWQTRVSVEYDFASGDDGGSSFGRFDTLYGTRRADFGPSGIYAAVGRANISSPSIRIEATPGPRLDGFMGYRALWLASRTDSFSTTGVRDASGQSGSFAGQQVEGRLRYWLVPRLLRVEGNAVVLFKGRFLTDAPNAPPAGNTHYVSLNVTATF